MNRQQRRRSDPEMSNEEAAGLAVLGAGAAVGVAWGAYQLFKYMTGPTDDEDHRGASSSLGSSSHVQMSTTLRNLDDLPFYNQRVRVVEDAQACKRAVNELRQHCSEFPVLGLDCEWNGWSGRPPVALLQLATHRGLCVLIRLCEMDTIPIELYQLLSDANVKKVGVMVERDMKYLCEDYQLVGRGALDLRPLAKKCGVPEPHGLAKLAEYSLGVKMDKQWTLSDWEADELSEEQIKYAAYDALVSFKLFQKYAETLFPRSVLTSQESWIQNVVKNL